MNLVALDRPERSLFWTAPAMHNGELSAEDPLGLDYVAQQVGLLLLPGFTTRSTRAQAYAVVLYGLRLAERAVDEYGYANTDSTKRQLFERWERLWALATLEFRGGPLPRGDWDSMRGVRGATAAWRPGGDTLPLDFTLISRQQELGNLGAYLVPLRRAGLVLDGGIRPTPAALELLDAFWGEADQWRHRTRYDSYAMTALDLSRKTIPRKLDHLTLAKLGQKSRLMSLLHDKRTAQQGRLFEALFERARDPHTHAIAQLVKAASNAGVFDAREVIAGGLAGRFGAVSTDLRDLLITAQAFGDFMDQLLGVFDRAYACIDQAGWVLSRGTVVTDVFDAAMLGSLRDAAMRLLDAPAVGALRSLPMHGGACVRLADELLVADASDALDRLLNYHATVQRDRRRGGGWIREDGGKLVLDVTSYSARGQADRFPSFKLNVVRSLLVDTGVLPYSGELDAPGVGA
jgi:hypothetical protein